MNLTGRSRTLMTIAAIAVLLLFVIVSVNIKKRAELSRTLKQFDEMASISGEFSGIGSDVGLIERRIGLTEGGQIPVMMEKIVSEMGLRSKLSSVKPIGGGDRDNYLISESEVSFDNLSVNELINVLYGIYTAPAGLFVTSADIKRDFSQGNLVDAKLNVKLVSFRKRSDG